MEKNRNVVFVNHCQYLFTSIKIVLSLVFLLFTSSSVFALGGVLYGTNIYALDNVTGLVKIYPDTSIYADPIAESVGTYGEYQAVNDDGRLAILGINSNSTSLKPVTFTSLEDPTPTPTPLPTSRLEGSSSTTTAIMAVSIVGGLLVIGGTIAFIVYQVRKTVTDPSLGSNLDKTGGAVGGVIEQVQQVHVGSAYETQTLDLTAEVVGGEG